MNKKSTPPNLLKHTDDDFRNAVQSIPIGILEIDLDNCIVFANKFALDLLQMTEKDIESGLCLKDIVSPSQIRAVSEGLKRLKEGTEPISMGIRVRRRDGVEIPTETTARLIIEKGVPVGYTSYSTDMTRRIAIEERIRQQEGLFSFILDHSSFVGILIVDDQFKIEYVNDRVCEIIGRTRGELQGSDFRAFIAEESLQLVADRYVRRQKGEKMPPEYSISIIRADNSIRNLKVSASLMTGADKSRKTVAQVIDITDELNQKKALEESEHQYRTLLETMDSGLCVDNESGICIMANQALCDMIGYPSPTDLVGKPIIQWIQGWTITEVEAKTAARKEGTADHYEVNLTHRSGEIIPAIVHASPWFDSSGEYLGSFSVFTDVSELKRAEAESRFLLDLLLHDIGNQLQLILAGADLLDRESTGEQIDNARRYVLDGASRCIELISNVRRAEESKSEPLVITDLAY
ncbi:MAG: PAS domain S-box protein, partial [Candidatus Thorarchaeota archaeon]